jgi:hypothetical protein
MQALDYYTKKWSHQDSLIEVPTSLLPSGVGREKAALPHYQLRRTFPGVSYYIFILHMFGVYVLLFALLGSKQC